MEALQGDAQRRAEGLGAPRRKRQVDRRRPEGAQDRLRRRRDGTRGEVDGRWRDVDRARLPFRAQAGRGRDARARLGIGIRQPHGRGEQHGLEQLHPNPEVHRPERRGLERVRQDRREGVPSEGRARGNGRDDRRAERKLGMEGRPDEDDRARKVDDRRIPDVHVCRSLQGADGPLRHPHERQGLQGRGRSGCVRRDGRGQEHRAWRVGWCRRGGLAREPRQQHEVGDEVHPLLEGAQGSGCGRSRELRRRLGREPEARLPLPAQVRAVPLDGRRRDVGAHEERARRRLGSLLGGSARAEDLVRRVRQERNLRLRRRRRDVEEPQRADPGRNGRARTPTSRTRSSRRASADTSPRRATAARRGRRTRT